MTLREEVVKSALNEDSYSRTEALKAVDGFAEEILKTIRSRIYSVEKGLEGQTSPENKEKGKNILTMLKSTEKMINEVWDNYRARI